MYHTALDITEFLLIALLIFIGSSKFDLPADEYDIYD